MGQQPLKGKTYGETYITAFHADIAAMHQATWTRTPMSPNQIREALRLRYPPRFTHSLTDAHQRRGRAHKITRTLAPPPPRPPPPPPPDYTKGDAHGKSKTRTQWGRTAGKETFAE
jgi:hypothetical protein